MPTREQNLKKAIEQAKQGNNIYAALQSQIDAIVKHLTSKK